MTVIEKINSLKENLNRLINIEGLKSEKVLELSRELDIFILEYHKNIDKDVPNEKK